MIFWIVLYISIGLIFDCVLMSKYKITKRTIPMWLVHVQAIFGWLPALIYAAFTQEDELESKLNQSIKDSGLIRPHNVIKMPGIEEKDK